MFRVIFSKQARKNKPRPSGRAGLDGKLKMTI